jgi:hypothetical protein
MAIRRHGVMISPTGCVPWSRDYDKMTDAVNSSQERSGAIAMRLVQLTSVVVLSFGSLFWTRTATAQPAPASTCVDDAKHFAEEIGTSVDHLSPKGDEIFLQPKEKVELRVACPSGDQRFPRLYLTWKAPYPPASYWNVVADTGTALTAASGRRVRLAAHQCHKLAVLAADKSGQIRQRGLGVECQVSTGSGGFTSVSLHRRSMRRP